MHHQTLFTNTLLLLAACTLPSKLVNAFQLSMVSTLNNVKSAQQLTPQPQTKTAKSTLYDMPISNNGARVRIILYKKNVPTDEVQIISPVELGGLDSPEYLARNPQGKMPLLTTEDIDIPESDTIARYMMSTYEHRGPSFLPNDAKSNLIARLHDMYLTTIQGFMYKATPPFGPFGTRSDALAEYQKQLQVIDDIISDDRKGLYLCGDEVSFADATLFPSMVFVDKILPKFGIVDNLMPAKIAKWYTEVREADPVFAKVHDEIAGALDEWQDNKHWDTIWLAGLRDEGPSTIFDKVIASATAVDDKKCPLSIVYNDDKVLAFQEEINPAAPVHVVVIPKDRMGLSGLREATPEHVEMLGSLLAAAGEVAKIKNLGFGEGVRIVINDGKQAGQKVPHLHINVLGGEEFAWPTTSKSAHSDDFFMLAPSNYFK